MAGIQIARLPARRTIALGARHRPRSCCAKKEAQLPALTVTRHTYALEYGTEYDREIQQDAQPERAPRVVLVDDLLASQAAPWRRRRSLEQVWRRCRRQHCALIRLLYLSRGLAGQSAGRDAAQVRQLRWRPSRASARGCCRHRRATRRVHSVWAIRSNPRGYARDSAERRRAVDLDRLGNADHVCFPGAHEVGRLRNGGEHLAPEHHDSVSGAIFMTHRAARPNAI